MLSCPQMAYHLKLLCLVLTRHAILSCYVVFSTSKPSACVSQGRIYSQLYVLLRRHKSCKTQLVTLPSHSILMPGLPVSVLTLQAPGAWQVSHVSVNLFSHWYDSIWNKTEHGKSGNRTQVCRSRGGHLNHGANKVVLSRDNIAILLQLLCTRELE